MEDASLDSIWLGLRVEEGGQDESAPADSSDAGMRFEVQSVRARTATDSSNAQLAAFITQTFGAVEMLCDSHARGVNLTREGDTAIRTGDMGSLELPLQAHTHLSWAFSDAGEYAIELSATAVNAPESVRSSRGTLYCAVGRDPQQLVDRLAKEQNVSASDIKVLSAGHADITARTGDGRLVLRADSSQGAVEYELNRTVVAVPSRTLQEVPAGGSYRFLRSGASEHRGQVYLLAHTVLGKHVHGEIDPHIWHSVPNAKASVQVIRDALISADPAGASEYATRTEQVMKELDALDAQLRQVYGYAGVGTQPGHHARRLPLPGEHLRVAHCRFCERQRQRRAEHSAASAPASHGRGFEGSSDLSGQVHGDAFASSDGATGRLRCVPGCSIRIPWMRRLLTTRR